MDETPFRIEPTRLTAPRGEIIDLVAEIAADAMRLGTHLHPRTAATLADLVRVMNCYYSNLIEGHNTRPRDIEAALRGETAEPLRRQHLQLEAVAHISVQRQIDARAAAGRLGEPAEISFIKQLHRDFYHGAPPALLRVGDDDGAIDMIPGAFRSDPSHDVSVGQHLPPSSHVVEAFMRTFEARFRLAGIKKAEGMIRMAIAHHRLNYIHPFPDGNGRVSRLVSHAMALKIGIGAHGLWSISRGLARGRRERTEYKRMMDHADSPRQGDLDGRGNLSEAALQDFVLWFLHVCHDQIIFMADRYQLEALNERLARLVKKHGLRPQGAAVLEEILMRGEMPRGAAMRVTGLAERTAREVVRELVALGIVASETPKAPLALRFHSAFVEDLFPALFPPDAVP
jgi:Fic family protein